MFVSAISPIFGPLGFGQWQAGIAILTGLVAKEVIVSSFGTLAGVDEANHAAMGNMLHGLFTPLSAFSFMVFVLLYMPCIASLGAIKQETHGYKWPLAMSVITLTTAYIVSLLVFNLGLLLGFQ